ncbi:MAG: 2-C-methyl-D-erythritol 4-phosphate cytidylyltransferase [Bacteroidales bacterium]|nr:2-C-methyl-D-erythritol 4-phosphate cytidylyltransferase [Bacteroidales bacterium]
MKTIALIVAGGAGKRMNSSTPKQFLLLNNLPVLMHTINAFYGYDKQMEIRIVLPEDETETWDKLCKEYNFKTEHKIFKGGETRFHSVKNGLEGIGKSLLVAVHDGVRPLVSKQTLENCIKTAEEYGSAVPVVDLTESIRKVENHDSVALNRNFYKLVQTPQVFQSDVLLDAYNIEYEDDFTDDASVVEKAGYKIYLAEGNRENIKITVPQDIEIAQVLLKYFKD